ncbi:MAG: hypothetical protein KGY41_10225 [Desulfovermiculus sp.]|nr:hypothetical protein [Desulfovermiculus sp.]
MTISSPNISREEHPFTVASSLTEPEGLQFIIRACGDWTHRVQDLRSGDQVFVDGPTVFSPIFDAPQART